MTIVAAALAFALVAPVGRETGSSRPPELPQDPHIARLELELQQSPDDIGSMWNLAYALFQRDDFDRAEALLLRSEEIGGPHWYPRLMRGSIAEKKFHYRTALALYHESEALSDSSEEPTRERERVESIVRELARYRRAKDRIDRVLAWTVALLGLTIGAAVFGISRIREKPEVGRLEPAPSSAAQP